MKNLNWYFEVDKVEEGEFMLVLDGPASGERVYL